MIFMYKCIVYCDHRDVYDYDIHILYITIICIPKFVLLFPFMLRALETNLALIWLFFDVGSLIILNSHDFYYVDL